MTLTSTASDTKTQTENNTVDIAVLELLASRICHDLISPVGAVHNGVEFLEESGVTGGEDAIGLIAHSAQMAAAKLQAFRLAYGAGGRDPNIKPADVQKVFEDLTGLDGKIKQDWAPEALTQPSIPAGYCKIMMGIMIMAVECLPKGGTVHVAWDEDKTTVTASGPDAAARPQVDDALNRTLLLDSLDPRLIHPYVLSSLAAAYDFSIEMKHDSDSKKVMFYLTNR